LTSAPDAQQENLHAANRASEKLAHREPGRGKQHHDPCQ
jgi:hypothetical protein